MRTTLNLDDEALDSAMKVSNGMTRTEVINEALRQYARRRRVRELLELRGRLHWEGDLDRLRKRSETAAPSSSDDALTTMLEPSIQTGAVSFRPQPRFDQPTLAPPARPVKLARSIAITSGKGGVGKSNLAVNLAVSFAKLGRKVCLFDADLVDIRGLFGDA